MWLIVWSFSASTVGITTYKSLFYLCKFSFQITASSTCKPINITSLKNLRDNSFQHHTSSIHTDFLVLVQNLFVWSVCMPWVFTVGLWYFTISFTCRLSHSPDFLQMCSSLRFLTAQDCDISALALQLFCWQIWFHTCVLWLRVIYVVTLVDVVYSYTFSSLPSSGLVVVTAFLESVVKM